MRAGYKLSLYFSSLELRLAFAPAPVPVVRTFGQQNQIWVIRHTGCWIFASCNRPAQKSSIVML
jgi:hypothetical protein